MSTSDIHCQDIIEKVCTIVMIPCLIMKYAMVNTTTEKQYDTKQRHFFTLREEVAEK